MDNYNKRKSFGGGKKFGGDRGNRSFGGDRGNKSFGGDRGKGRDRSDVQMHTAICSDCNKKCEVPFRPTGDKPVFCSDCFKNKRDSQDSRGSRDNRGSKPSFDNKKSFQRGGDTQNYKAQFESLNIKLDKILKILNPDVTEEIFGKVDEVSKVRKFEKAPEKKKPAKKEVNTTDLKKALEKTSPVVKKKSSVKKVEPKKVVAKKLVSKKAPVKKTTAKKKK